MAIEAGKNIIDSVILSASLSVIYTVPSTQNRTKVDAIAFTNYGSSNVKITVQLVSKGGNASDEKILIKEKEIRACETYLAPELNGQGISEGGTIQAMADIPSSVSCTATGTIYT